MRDRHARLIGVLLASPFLAAVAAGPLLPSHFGAAGMLAFICAACGAAWLPAALAAKTGKDNAADMIGLVAGCAVIAVLIAAAGMCLSLGRSP